VTTYTPYRRNKNIQDLIYTNFSSERGIYLQRDDFLACFSALFLDFLGSFLGSLFLNILVVYKYLVNTYN
jgi:hypothetical protein